MHILVTTSPNVLNTPAGWYHFSSGC